MKNLARIFVASFMIICFLQNGHAAFYYSDTRSTSAGELVSDDAWAGGAQVTFTVQQRTDGKWSYTYTFTDLQGRPLQNAQFLKIEASNVAGANYYYASGSNSRPLTLITQDPGFHLWDTSSQNAARDTNHYMAAGSAYASHLRVGGNADEARASAEIANQVRELSDGSITIISSQAPMWGSFYLRGPSGSSNGPPELLNRGFNGGVFQTVGATLVVIPGSCDRYGRNCQYTYSSYYGSVGSAPVLDPNDLDDPNARYWILVPDSRTDLNNTPIPAAVWLFGSGLIGLIGFRRFRR